MPSVISETKDFYSNIYGIALEKHIFPFSSYNFGWKMQQMKEYRKVMPNYVVVLVNKVMDEAGEIANEDANRLENRFYGVSTYCRIKYHPSYTELIGLYRVRVNKIQEVKEEVDANAEKAS